MQKNEDRRFHNGEQALTFWFEFSKLVDEFGMPSLALNDEVVIGNLPRSWDYPDWWYDWVSIDKAFGNIGDADLGIINDFFKQGFQYSKQGMSQWRYKRKWQGVTQRAFRLVPEGMKSKEKKRWRKMK